MIYVNEAFVELFGYTKEEAVGKTTLELGIISNPKIRARVIAKIQKHGFVHDYGLKVYTKSGEVRRVLNNIDVIEFRGQRYLLSTLQDITERKKIEEALKDSEEQFRRAIEDAPIPTVMHAEDGQVLQISKTWTDLTGYSIEDIPTIDAWLTEAVYGEGANKVRNHMHELFSGSKRTMDMEFQVRTKNDGRIRTWSFSASSPGTLRDGRRFIVGMALDITERKKAEEALRKAHDDLEIRIQERTVELEAVNQALAAELIEHRLAEERIRDQATLLDNAQDAVAVRDLKQRITYWNKGAERLYGWTADEVLGRNADEFFYKETSRPVEAKKSVLEKGEWIGELNQVTKDGREIIVQGRWTLMRDQEGRPKSILIINTDVTKKKNLEAQLLRAQRLESIGMLANGISHDLNNILSPIMISLALLREEVKGDEGQKTIDILEKSGVRAVNLVKRIQSFTRGVEVERKPLQIAHIILETGQIIRETFPRNIEIETHVTKNLSTIQGDATQLHQVLMNLCLNARDSMPNGGKLSISAANFYVDEDYAHRNIEAKVGPYIVITTSDTGTGISPNIIDKIFDPFFTTKELGKGTGLGLPTALAIVKGHGGFINVYSEVGKGTALRVYLPAVTSSSKKAEEEEEEEEEEELTGFGETILVAEDEDSVSGITKLMLEKYGYNVVTAKDGAEAITVYKKNKGKIKLVLMDLMMPSMDGESSIKALRKINQKIKIIAVSGLVQSGENTKIKSITQAFLQKPYTTKKLLTTIHEVLNSTVRTS